MKTTFGLILFVLLGVLTSHGQTDTTSVPFVSYWCVGDSYDFRVTKIQRQEKAGQLIKNDSISYIANFEVIDSTETSYKIRWNYKTNLGGLNIPNNLIEKLSKYQMTEVIYETTEVGEFVGVENWQEIAKMMKALFSDLIDLMVETKKADKATLQKAVTPFESLFGSKEGIEQLALKELHYLHFPFGIEYSTTEVIEYQQELPNMFGGNPINGDTKIYIESVDFENSFCVLIEEMQLNPEDTRNMLYDVFKQMDVTEQQLDTAMKTAKINVTDNNKYEYWYNPGIPYRIEAQRVTDIDVANEKGKRIDITRIEIVE
ncbi:hypothetical protein [Parapedobacter koreensis]|uniref:Uncharacterized protein n=1 Tax=Parapedobacter koreensis TaxID=332977 RepID=A0A1H7ULI9_9SPHI|nr:hypothetical protein [Parapedobacter koreensis]SEL97880.1 hypothetical protein SAMN05421740_11812 [Parapedobacter koreensis]